MPAAMELQVCSFAPGERLLLAAAHPATIATVTAADQADASDQAQDKRGQHKRDTHGWID